MPAGYRSIDSFFDVQGAAFDSKTAYNYFIRNRAKLRNMFL